MVALAIALASILPSCNNEKKAGEEQKTPIEKEAEDKVLEIESQYESTSDDFNEGENITQELEKIETIKTSDENDQATKELRKFVTIHRDLVKKYKATGNADFKEQALVVEEKARKIQEKLSNSQYQARSPQIRENGDLFLEMDASIKDLRN